MGAFQLKGVPTVRQLRKKPPRSGSESLPLTRACCPNSKESKHALAGEELRQPTLVVAWECVRRSVN